MSRVRSYGGNRIRVSAWRGDEATAYIAPLPNGRPLGAPTIRACVDSLIADGYAHVVTAALSAEERTAFPVLGFTEREHLHLLAHNMTRLPQAEAVKIRRARRSDRGDVLALDNAAFNQFWQLDADGLNEALHATPVARFRVAYTTTIAGYAVTGRAGDRGYLQRLAVHPDQQGAGIGMALVADCLEWLKRRGVHTTLVNTQVDNTTAVRLYQRAGFVLQRDGLIVYEMALDA